MKKKVELVVEYQLNEIPFSMAEVDGIVDEAVGKRSYGSGCFLPTSTRDMSFEVPESDVVKITKRIHSIMKREGISKGSYKVLTYTR